MCVSFPLVPSATKEIYSRFRLTFCAKKMGLNSLTNNSSSILAYTIIYLLTGYSNDPFVYGSFTNSFRSSLCEKKKPRFHPQTMHQGADSLPSD